MNAVLFDLFGVIIDKQRPDGIARIEEVVKVSGPKLWDVYWKHRPAHDGGQDGISYWRQVLAEIGSDADPADALQADLDSWKNPKPAMIDVVLQVSNRNPTGILSNVTAELTEWLLRTQSWFEDLEFVILSSVEGVVKPNPQAYELALEKFGLPADEVMFVDDTQANLDTAAKLGMHTHLFTTQSELIPVLERWTY